MRRIQLLFLCLAAVILAIQAVPICLLFDPAVVDSANAVAADSEPQTIRAGALQFNHTVILIENSISVTAWSAALDQCSVLILPEFETGTFLPVDATLSDADRTAILNNIRDFTSRGGLTVSSGSPENIDFLNIAFNLPYTHGDDLFGGETELNRTAAGAATSPFSSLDAPNFLMDWDASFTAADVPADECMYQGDDTATCAVTFARYNDGNTTSLVAAGGAVMYVAWDWWNSAPAGEQVGGGWVPLLFNQVVDQDCDDNGVVDSLQADCNANSIADVCEIATDPSLDCNGNGILDECELNNETAAVLDCNGNGALDTCEIDADATLDCDNNNVLDTCQDPVPECGSTAPTSASTDGTDESTDGSEPTDGTSGDGDGDGVGDGDGDRSSAMGLRGWTFFF